MEYKLFKHIIWKYNKCKTRNMYSWTTWLWSYLVQRRLKLRGCWCQTPGWFLVSTRLGLLWSTITPLISEYAWPHVGVRTFAPSEASGLEVWSAQRTEESFRFECAQTKQILRFLVIFGYLCKSRKTLFYCYFIKLQNTACS